MRVDPKLVVHLDALENLPATGKRRTTVISFLKDLARVTGASGDFELRDPETHRMFQVNVVAGYAISWWVDAPVNELKIVDIRPVL